MIAGLPRSAPNREREPRSASIGDGVPSQRVPPGEPQPVTDTPSNHELQTPPTSAASAGSVVTLASSPAAVSAGGPTNDNAVALPTSAADAPAADALAATDPAADQGTTVNLGRIGWTVTMLACLVAVAILVLEGYYGYAAVTFAVAMSAGINLF